LGIGKFNIVCQEIWLITRQLHYATKSEKVDHVDRGDIFTHPIRHLDPRGGKAAFHILLVIYCHIYRAFLAVGSYVLEFYIHCNFSCRYICSLALRELAV